MRIEASSATDVGLVREANEDRALCGTTVFAVADGLGGHAAGEVAAQLAVQRLGELDGRRFGDPSEAAQALAGAVRQAHRDVEEAAQADPGRAGMGTTLTAATVVEDRLVLAHVGDSRAYLFDPGDGLMQLTADHTAVSEAVRAGLLPPAAADRHPQRHMLTQAVGLEGELEVDTPPPVALRPGHRVLLCSDGLTEAVPADAVAAHLAEAAGSQAACDALVRAALAAGGPDNVTVVVLSVVPDGTR
jgi:protein phosphatase